MNQQEIFGQYETKLHHQIIKVFHASGMKLHDNRLGSKIYTNYQRVSLIVLFILSRKALRDFVFELTESIYIPQLISDTFIAHILELESQFPVLTILPDKSVSE